ncbi:GUN4 domain protein (plasmid) [Calothrix sp. NIES-4071]|nr:GUN4 domain protein [Calothrix sp. NIES-4071]BAZ64971.1 GUN4 domain protein [Calothrix sp. NIES-4105]
MSMVFSHESFRIAIVMTNTNQTGKYDAVLGNHHINTNSGVLGGIQGVKQRLLAPEVSYRIAALDEALNHGQEGLNLIVEALNNPNRFVRVYAYEILDKLDKSEILAKLIQFRERHYLIHFNGIYQCDGSKHYSYLRFYPDYTVITTSTMDTPEKVITWFNKENNDIYSDIYIVENKKEIIRFFYQLNNRIVDFVAKTNIYGTNINLKWFSRRSKSRGSDEYRFIKISS